MDTLRTNEMKKLFEEQGEDFHPINVLGPDAFRDQRIPGSVNIPNTEDDFAEKVERYAGGKGKPVIVYCAGPDCDASEKAAKKLEEAGFTSVSDYVEGLKGWNEFGLPLDSGS